MPNRIIKETIHTSETVNSMTDFQFRLWISLITYVDDFGRGDARAAVIKGACFPLRERVTIKDIDAALKDLAGIGCVGLYEVDGKPYLYFPTWESHQSVRNQRSKYPAPEDGITIESNCKQLNSTDCKCSRNPIQSESNPNPNPKGKRAGAFVPPTLKEIEDYCLERNSTVDPKQFYDYFTEGEWKDAKGNAVKNWKQKLLTWEKYDAKDGKKQSDAQKHVSESFAKQSETEKLDYMKRMMQHIGGGNDNT